MAKKAESAETKSKKKDTAKKSEDKKAADTKAAKTKDTDKKGSKSKDADKKAAKTKDAKKGGIKKYFKDLRSEIKKVVWPSREKVVNNTGIVIGVMMAGGLALFGIDSLLGLAINALLNFSA